MQCPNCRKELRDNLKFCTGCGCKLPEISECRKCGAEIDASLNFCPKCGNKLKITSPGLEHSNQEAFDQPTHPLYHKGLQKPYLETTHGPYGERNRHFADSYAAPQKKNNTLIYILLTVIIVGVGLFVYFFFTTKSTDSNNVIKIAVENPTKDKSNKTEEKEIRNKNWNQSQTEENNKVSQNNYVGYDKLKSLPSGGSMDQFSYLSNVKLTREDIKNYTPSELRILRNAIFARHGYIFQSTDLKEYFGRFYDYNPSTTTSPQLNSIENANIALIKSYE